MAVIPTAAPARSLPCESCADAGYLIDFSISFIVISPLNLNSSSTIGSFSFLALPRIFLASSRVIPTGAVTRFSLVIHSLIGLEKSSSNLRSLLVIIPTSFLSSSVIGTPEILNLPISSLASCNVLSGCKKNGSVITPFSDLFTLSTSSACCSTDIFLWIIPIPPCLAIAIAILCSVTVSIPALIKGILSLIFFVRLVVKSIILGVTSEYCGTNNTSSNVMPSPIIVPIFLCPRFPVNKIIKL